MKRKCAACDHVVDSAEPPVVCPNCGLDGRRVVIGPRHPNDGNDWDAACARCGSTAEWIHCERCDGMGVTEPGELYEEDPLWYDEDDQEPCHQCGGEARWLVCSSPAEWCERSPLDGRAKVKRGAFEWFLSARADAEKENGR